MKGRNIGIVILLACCALGIACVSAPSQPVVRQTRVNVQVTAGAEDEPFYDDLAGYGEWVYVSGPGWVWSPYDTPAGWRPYQLGHWVYTDYGWTWASDESYGWAVYHYGRWCNNPQYGWVWVPGTEWGPAWVAWNEGAGWVGWAPLPYQVSWRAGIGLDWGGVNVNVALGPSAWYFVQARDLVSPGWRYRAAPVSRNITLIQVTQHVTNYTYVDNRIIDRSVKVEKIGRAVGHTIPRYRVRPADSPGNAPGGKVSGQEFVLFRPNPVRGAKSQGRVDPPGHDGGRHPVDRGRNSGWSDETSNEEPGEEPQGPVDRGRHAGRSDEASSSEPVERQRYPADRGRHETRPHEAAEEPAEASSPEAETAPPSSPNKQRPPRYPRGSEPQPARAPHQPPTPAAPPSTAAPDQDEPLASPAENRAPRRSPGDGRGNAAPSGQNQSGPTSNADRGTPAAQSGKPETANAPSEKPAPGKSQPAKPGQSKPHPAGAKGKKPADSAAKPEKPKPEEKDSKGSSPEEAQSEDSDSGNQD
jgi:hypothetical protein